MSRINSIDSGFFDVQNFELTPQQKKPILELMQDGYGVFRNGFMITHKSNPPHSTQSALRSHLEKNWERMEIGSFQLLFDSQAPIHTHSGANSTVVILGDIYCNNGRSIEDILAHLERSPGIDDLHSLDLGGRFACLKIQQDRLWVFNDAIGSRSIYYAYDGRIIVASHLGLIQEFFTTIIDRHTRQAMQSQSYTKRVVKYLPGDLTICQLIYRLTANHAYDSALQGPIRYWPQAPAPQARAEDVYEALERSLQHLMAHIKTRGYAPITSLTGGVDCRTVAAAMRQADMAPHTMTWRDLNFERAEAPVVEQLRQAIDGHHYNVTLRPKSKSQPELDNLSLAAHYNCGMITTGVRALCLEDFTHKARATLPPDQTGIFVNGYGGEIIRAFYEKKGRSHLGFANAEKLAGLYGGLGNDAEFRRFVMRAFKEFRARTQFSPPALHGYNSYDMFYWEHRTSLWAVGTMDGTDVVMHGLAGFNSREAFAKAIALPEEERLTKEITINFIKKIDEELSNIPFA